MAPDPRPIPSISGQKRKREIRPTETPRHREAHSPLGNTPPSIRLTEHDLSSHIHWNIQECDTDSAPEWLEGIKNIERTHRALNIVFTFCCTRKHVVTTFRNIKAAVESHVGKPLTIEDVAEVIAVRPGAINFAYVEESTLQNERKGSERDTTFKATSPRDIKSQGPPPDASVGGLTGLHGLDSQPSIAPVDEEGEVLLFEFVDGDLKQEPRKPTESNTGFGPSRDKTTLKLPVYSQADMSSLINRRNQKFSDCLGAIIDRGVRSKMDPLEYIRERAKTHLPTPSVPRARCEAVTIPDTIPETRKSISDIIFELRSCPWYTGQVIPEGHRVFEPQAAVYGDLNFRLSQDLVNALFNSRGIVQLYAHQAEALNCLLSGSNVVVATSTSSGKSLIYQLPVIHALEQDLLTRAMYIFPTKALAQDQKRSLHDLICYVPALKDILVATFDGDTPWSDRAAIRESARVIFTNPDMLHLTILPNEEKWRGYLQHLKYVVGKRAVMYLNSGAKD
ncbi:related to helicases [Cephalotrichum gorgonifer]|uniref:Related to helicases n=1 Tax=Cephalotrichum gorgonifer TaxID=2041049 RepID=A0AAE8SYE6_9PEZI|nr:related to helicases [Cephalotrichum gorgonifer]